jgi:hypothetical protein
VDDELPRVTLTHLRRADTMCRRRLEREHMGAKGNRSASARFAVSNRLTEDARVAHTELRSARLADFPTPIDLVSEQQRVYRAAAAGYVVLFADRPARAVTVDPWESVLDDVGMRLVASLGLALERADGSPELRILRIGVAGNRPMIDDADRRAIVVRSAPWVGDRRLALVVTDLLAGAIVEDTLDVDGALAEARSWIDARLAVVRERVADPVPKAGDDCSGCAFVSGCKAHLS